MVLKCSESATEEWMPIPGFEGLYEASTLGRIRSLDRIVAGRIAGTSRKCPGTIIKPNLGQKGYLRTQLCKEGRIYCMNAHTAICAAFHGPRPEGKEAAHLDGSKDNNAPENLAWKTHAENEADKRLHGTLATGLRNGHYTKPHRTPRGESHGATPFTAEDIAEIREIYDSGEMGSHRIAKQFGVSKTAIHAIVTHKTWRHV